MQRQIPANKGRLYILAPHGTPGMNSGAGPGLALQLGDAPGATFPAADNASPQLVELEVQLVAGDEHVDTRVEEALQGEHGGGQQVEAKVERVGVHHAVDPVRRRGDPGHEHDDVQRKGHAGVCSCASVGLGFRSPLDWGKGWCDASRFHRRRDLGVRAKIYAAAHACCLCVEAWWVVSFRWLAFAGE